MPPATVPVLFHIWLRCVEGQDGVRDLRKVTLRNRVTPIAMRRPIPITLQAAHEGGWNTGSPLDRHKFVLVSWYQLAIFLYLKCYGLVGEHSENRKGKVPCI